MKKFDIPQHFKSPIISRVKDFRKLEDPRKKNFSPTVLDFGPVKLLVARHFGFCYGVENAIEIAYKTVEENPGKRIFLLSEMIHNPAVNEDLQSRGIKFIMDNYGKHFVEWDEITSDDIVIIPAFGTTVEMKKYLSEREIDTIKYNTTCPFVERVWNKAESIGKKKFTVVIHGKSKHEETRATFSHSIQNSPSIIIRDENEAKFLADIILDKAGKVEFYSLFNEKYSKGFDVYKDLERIGVVNQTTMLASETEAITEILKRAMLQKYGAENLADHFADTRDTLCYATNDNQSATIELLNAEADLAVVVGGYNSSNTSHLVELLERKYKTFFVSGANKIISKNEINHFDIASRSEQRSKNFLPDKEKINIALTSGASCPDSIVDEVLNKILSFFESTKNIEEVLKEIN